MRVARQVTQLIGKLSEGETWGVSDLARTLDMDKSSVHRILRTLLDEQWVQQDPESRKYSVGAALRDLSDRTGLDADLPEAGDAILSDLARRFNETVLLSVRRGLRNVVEAVRESTQEARVASEPGRRVPLHCGAAGKTLMAFDAGRVAERVIAGGLPAFTSNTITDPDRLRAELAETRARGWGYEDQEYSYGVIGLGVPIWGPQGALFGAIALRAPSTRMNRDRAAEMAPTIIEAAAEITRRLDRGTDRTVSSRRET